MWEALKLRKCLTNDTNNVTRCGLRSDCDSHTHANLEGGLSTRTTPLLKIYSQHETSGLTAVKSSWKVDTETNSDNERRDKVVADTGIRPNRVYSRLGRTDNQFALFRQISKNPIPPDRGMLRASDVRPILPLKSKKEFGRFEFFGGTSWRKKGFSSSMAT